MYFAKLAFVQDADGNVVFENIQNTEDTGFEVVSEYEQEATGKRCPRSFTYTFGLGSSSVVYALESTLELEAQDNYSMAPAEVQAMFDQAKIRPSYTRWAGRGRMELHLEGVTSEHEGDAIFEMIFSGTKYRDSAE